MLNGFIPNNCPPHETIDVKLKGVVVAIDVRMVEIVKWLNSFSSVTTDHSCEGNFDKRYMKFNAYVTFYSDEADLKRILDVIHPVVGSGQNTTTISFGEVEVRHYISRLRYKLDFVTAEIRDGFTQSLTTGVTAEIIRNIGLEFILKENL